MENQSWKEKVEGVRNYLKVHLTNLFLMIKENKKIVAIMAVFLVVVVGALFLGKIMEKQSESVVAVAPENSSEGETEVVSVPEEALEKDAYPEVNNLIKQYYQALQDGDVETIRSIKSSTDDKEEITIEKKSEYIESYPAIEVYTKKGPVEGTLVAYVRYEVKFNDYDATVPGVNPLYICQREDGSYYINEDVDQETVEYIKVVTAHNDVIDLYNTVQVQYNEVLTEDQELSGFLAQLPDQLKESVNLALIELEKAKEPLEPEEIEIQPEIKTVVTKVKATDVVNVRSSDSIEADRIGKTSQGQILDLIEERVNGWSKVNFEGKEGFIKSEFLEPEETMVVTIENEIQEEEAPAGEEENTEAASQSTEAEKEEDTTDQNTTPAKGKLTDTVNVRKEPSTSGDRVGQLYLGETVDIIEKMSNGWTKIKYKDGEAYVKSEFIE